MLDSTKAQKTTGEIFALDTIISITIYSEEDDGEEQLALAEKNIREYEKLLSKTVDSSFTSTLNKDKTYDLSTSPYSQELTYLVDRSKYFSSLTDNLFDVTIEPLVRLWGFGTENPHVPSEKDIQETLKKIDSNNLKLQDNTVVLENDATVDFGGIAKGYIADLIKRDLIQNGVNSGIINFGGNVLTIGAKPDGETWAIGVRDPEDEMGSSMGILDVTDKTVVTSGTYERCFEEDGKVYHHILDKRTGYPSTSPLYSVTIVADKSLDADALSTGAFILGVDKGLELIESLDGVDAIFYPNDGSDLIFTDGFEEKYNFELSE